MLKRLCHESRNLSCAHSPQSFVSYERSSLFSVFPHPLRQHGGMQEQESNVSPGKGKHAPTKHPYLPVFLLKPTLIPIGGYGRLFLYSYLKPLHNKSLQKSFCRVLHGLFAIATAFPGLLFYIRQEPLIKIFVPHSITSRCRWKNIARAGPAPSCRDRCKKEFPYPKKLLVRGTREKKTAEKGKRIGCKRRATIRLMRKTAQKPLPARRRAHRTPAQRRHRHDTGGNH